MDYTTNSEEVSSAIKFLNIDAKMLTGDLSLAVISRVVERFTGFNKYQYPLWENIINDNAIRRQYAWEVFSKLLRNKEVILLFDFADDKNIFLFSDGAILSKIFENCFKFVFYVTNVENDFLLAYNDHDYLIGAGEAITWIDDIKSGKYDI